VQGDLDLADSWLRTGYDPEWPWQSRLSGDASETRYWAGYGFEYIAEPFLVIERRFISYRLVGC